MATPPDNSVLDAERIDLTALSEAITFLMVRYSDAIEACGPISRLSLLPLLKLYFQMLLWLFALELVILLLPITIITLIVRKVFGRSRVIVGERLHAMVAKPFRSAWEGEITSFRIIHQRYLTRLFLFYRAQFLINSLHRIYNRRNLDLLVAKPIDSEALKEAEQFQKCFVLFQQITTDSYQLGALAVGGPLVALFSIGVQKALLPAAGYLWNVFGGPSLSFSPELIGTFGGFFIIFAFFAMWVMASAWMDMREVMSGVHVYEAERQACLIAGIKGRREVPFDLLVYFIFVGLFVWSSYEAVAIQARHIHSAQFDPDLESTFRQIQLGEMSIFVCLMLYFGIAASVRRYYLFTSRSPSVVAARRMG